jgi:hypothetical protein
MRQQMEQKLQESQAEFARKSAELNTAIEGRIQERIKDQINEANKSVEEKLQDIRKGMESERQRMSETLDKLGVSGQRAVVPAAAPVAEGEVDMAERFFARQGWRASASLPLQVLGGMFVAGVVATGLVLRRRDLTGR